MVVKKGMPSIMRITVLADTNVELKIQFLEIFFELFTHFNILNLMYNVTHAVLSIKIYDIIYFFKIMFKPFCLHLPF